jgi:hypothetical protein
MEEKMKVYTYTPEELGFEEFPLGTCRLAGDDVIQVRDPDVADVFVIPPMIVYIDWGHIPYFKGNEAKHVCINIRDNLLTDTPPDVMAFRCECMQKILKRNPSTIPWPWPVRDVRKEILCEDAIKYDISFRGWVHLDLCEKALQSIEKSSLNFHIYRTGKFWAYIPEEEQIPLRRSFIDAMQSSLLTLSVLSLPLGVIRYRFYESMAMGRMVVHINDFCTYPLEDRIDYSRFVIKIPASKVGKTGKIVEEYLRTHTSQEILENGQYARKMWKRWLNSTYWPEIMTEIVREKL